jgi:hypothetical protein
MPTTQDHASLAPIELHEDKRMKQPARAASIVNVKAATQRHSGSPWWSCTREPISIP